MALWHTIHIPIGMALFLSAFVLFDNDTLDVVAIIDILLTLFFLFDFNYRILTTKAKSAYFFKKWGWADLLACLPVFRIFRLFRIVRAIFSLQ